MHGDTLPSYRQPMWALLHLSHCIIYSTQWPERTLGSLYTIKSNNHFDSIGLYSGCYFLEWHIPYKHPLKKMIARYHHCKLQKYIWKHMFPSNHDQVYMFSWLLLSIIIFHLVKIYCKMITYIHYNIHIFVNFKQWCWLLSQKVDPLITKGQVCMFIGHSILRLVQYMLCKIWRTQNILIKAATNRKQ
jgi:hypothetical protein